MMQQFYLTIYKVLCLSVILFVGVGCGRAPETNAVREEKTPEEISKKEKIPKITNEELKDLFNLAIKAEDHIRGNMNDKEIEVDGMPYILLREDIKSMEALQNYLKQVYSEKATQAYITHLELVPAEEGHLGRHALYFYNQYYPFDRQDLMEIKLLAEEGNRKTYQIVLPMMDMGMPGEQKITDNIDTLKNVQVIWEKGIWKFNVMYSNMRTYY